MSVLKVFKKIFSRMALTLLLILIQIAAIMALEIFLIIQWWPFAIEFALIGLIVFFLVINRKGAADLKLPWVIIVLAFPLLGVLLYAFFANHGLKPKYRRIVKAVNNKGKEFFKTDSLDMQRLKESENPYTTPFEYLGYAMKYTATYGNRVTYYKSGEEWFPKFIESLKSAKEFIFMEFFIIDRGKEWTAIHEVLAQKAKEGVEVRLVYDDIGCAGLLHSWYPEQLRKEGIKCYRFNPFIPLLSGIFNNRDHRKIAVIDHKEAFTGGMNLADEYANDIVRFGYWKDAMIKIEGPAINNLIYLFLSIYDLCQNKLSDYDKYLNYNYQKYDECALVSPFGDGPAPFISQNAGESTFVNMIENAKKSVYICTPYFIPTENLKSAIVRAGYRGIDIRILVPGIPDKKAVYKMAVSNFKELIKAGVKVYTYNEGFNHQKSIVVDGEVAFVGTINMDYRSLVHHFECGAIFMHSAAVKEVENDLLDCFDHSELVLKENINLGVMTSFMIALMNVFVQML